MKSRHETVDLFFVVNAVTNFFLLESILTCAQKIQHAYPHNLNDLLLNGIAICFLFFFTDSAKRNFNILHILDYQPIL